jgi:hypothetical protein
VFYVQVRCSGPDAAWETVAVSDELRPALRRGALIFRAGWPCRDGQPAKQIHVRSAAELEAAGGMAAARIAADSFRRNAERIAAVVMAGESGAAIGWLPHHYVGGDAA